MNHTLDLTLSTPGLVMILKLLIKIRLLKEDFATTNENEANLTTSRVGEFGLGVPDLYSGSDERDEESSGEGEESSGEEASGEGELS